MAIELSQHLREKIILNNILATDFDLNIKNNYRTLIYNNFLLKNKRINFISFFDGPPLWCFGPMSTVSTSDIFVKWR